jgi:D-alanyl-D-alanine carboxypeptidase
VAASVNSLVPQLRDAAAQLVAACAQAGLSPRITSTRRSHAQQKRLYEKFISGRWPYPVAAPGTSAHEFGYAFDMVVEPYDALADVGKVWESWGGVWGGHYNDPIHFELPGFKSPVMARNAVPSPDSVPFLAQALDFILSFNPAIGLTELLAWMLSLGFPQNQVLKYLQNPVASIW